MSKSCFGYYEGYDFSWHCLGCVVANECRNQEGGKIMRSEVKFDMAREYNSKIDKMRQNRVEVSFYKYGPARINFGEGLVKAKNSAEMCIKKYEETKNKEYLLDAMNYLMFEFDYPSIDGAYFKPTDSSESAGKDGVSINGI